MVLGALEVAATDVVVSGVASGVGVVTFTHPGAESATLHGRRAGTDMVGSDETGPYGALGATATTNVNAATTTPTPPTIPSTMLAGTVDLLNAARCSAATSAG